MQIRPCLQSIAHAYHLITHRINDGNLFQLKILFKWTVYLLCAAKNFRFSFVQTHRYIIFADTSGLFNGDRLKHRYLATERISKLKSKKHIPYKKREKIHQVHVITCFNRLICPRVKIMFQKMSQHQQNNAAWHMCHTTNKNNPWQKRNGFANKLQNL